MDQLLGGGFAIAAGDGDKGDAELAAMMEGELLEGCEDISNDDEAIGYIGGKIIEGLGGRFVDDGVGGALFESFGGKGIAVEVGTFERKEKVAVRQLPRIRPDRRMTKEDLV